MRLMKIGITIFLMVLMLNSASKSEALIVINEFLADPAADISGDANNDGTRSGTEDEFIELLNFDENSIDISGWVLTDSVGTRHIFPAGTSLSPYEYFVLFGGGTPNLPEVNWQVATTGGLGLNNGGDTISLIDADSQLIHTVTYGSLAGNDQSLVLLTEGEGDQYVLHSSVHDEIFSPGTGLVTGPVNSAAIPEPLSILTFATGGLALLSRRHKNLLVKFRGL